MRAIKEWLEVEDRLQDQVLELLVTGDSVVLESTVEWLQDKGFEVHSEQDDPEGNYSFATFVGWEYFNAQDVIKILEALKS